ncbi:MAG TPA: hypothetical protein VFL61_00320 [Gaiellaceae bacterium]|nr:hypothetical protein [Gaiellaceae bacterium]
MLDPILRLAERIDRARLRPRPVRSGGLIGIRLERHRGEEVILQDGTVIRRGALVGAVHLDNRVVRRYASDDRLADGFAAGREELRLLAGWARDRAPSDRPVAYSAKTILAAFARRVGFEEVPAPTAPDRIRGRLEDWYLRGVLARWAPQGRRRLRQGRGGLRAVALWLSAAELERRYGGEG